MTTNEAINVVIREALAVTEIEYRLYEINNNGTWNLIREMTWDEMGELKSQWLDFGGYIDNDFGVIDQTIRFTHNFLDRVFIAQRI